MFVQDVFFPFLDVVTHVLAECLHMQLDDGPLSCEMELFRNGKVELVDYGTEFLFTAL